MWKNNDLENVHWCCDQVYIFTQGNYLYLGPSYNRPDLNTYTWSHHVYTLGNYLHQGPSYSKPDLNTYTTCCDQMYVLRSGLLYEGPWYK
jgi:hypothetical protein